MPEGGWSKVTDVQRTRWFQWPCPDGHLVDAVFTGDLSLGHILITWSPLIFRAVEVISWRLWPAAAPELSESFSASNPTL